MKITSIEIRSSKDINSRLKGNSLYFYYEVSPEILTAWQDIMKESLSTSEKINTRYLY